MSPRGRPRRMGYSALLTAPLSVWDRRRSLLVSSNSTLRLFLGQRWFVPGEDPSSFRRWREGGLTHFSDISTKGRLCLR